MILRKSIISLTCQLKDDLAKSQLSSQLETWLNYPQLCCYREWHANISHESLTPVSRLISYDSTSRYQSRIALCYSICVQFHPASLVSPIPPSSIPIALHFLSEDFQLLPCHGLRYLCYDISGIYQNASLRVSSNNIARSEIWTCDINLTKSHESEI